jgi:MFS family permease
MKEMGVTDEQLGIIIAAGFLSAAFFSLFGGIITDYLGRKRTAFIFDFLAWPTSIFIYLISRSLIMFILATVINNLVKIVTVAWNLMVIEDADSDQRIAAFNLLNIINISLGILTPLAGLVVAKYGIIKAERTFMIFAIISMTAMIIIRDINYTETKVGKQILEEHKGLAFKDVLKKGLYGGTITQLRNNSRLKIAFLVQVLFNLTLPLGAFNSMYFAPFMTGQLGIDKAAVSILGGVYAGVMLLVFS